MSLASLTVHFFLPNRGSAVFHPILASLTQLVPKTHPLHNFSVWLSPKTFSTCHDYTPSVAREAMTRITAKKSRTPKTVSVMEKAWDEAISGLEGDVGRKDVTLDSMLYSKE